MARASATRVDDAGFALAQVLEAPANTPADCPPAELDSPTAKLKVTTAELKVTTAEFADAALAAQTHCDVLPEQFAASAQVAAARISGDLHRLSADLGLVSLII